MRDTALEAAGAGPDDLRRALQAEILEGELGPRQRLIETDLCERHGATRSAVRAALQQLSFEGLVEMQRNRGATVRAISLDEAIEITEVRAALEGLCAGRAAELATGEQVGVLQALVERMRLAVEGGEVLTYSDLNASLHREIRAISGHALCSRLLEQLRAQMVRHQFALSLQPGRPAVSLLQHEAVVEAIASGDQVGAEEAMRHHLRSVVEALRAMPPSRLA
jgi:DNA-binding GntR family transcriptional regulator